MKIESPDFTAVNVRAFLDEVLEHERLHLVDRLTADSSRLAALVEQGVAQHSGGEHWSGHEVLAHIVVLSKFYGTLTSQVGSGKMSEVDVLSAARARDVAAEPLLPLPAAALLQMAQREHQRTISYLRGATALDLARRVTMVDEVTMSAQEIASLPLCGHLEIHLEQLEQASKS